MTQYTIDRIPMTRDDRITPGRARPIACVVLHATAGTWPSDLAWLRKGGHDDPVRGVSCHYCVGPQGQIVQLVDEADTAWHAGASTWRGLEHRGSLNACSVGVELSHRQDGTPFPAAQVQAAAWLAREIVRRHGIERGNVVRHLDVSPGRKRDPAGLDWPAFLEAVFASTAFSPDTPILAGPSVPLDALRAVLRRVPDANRIAAAYTTLGHLTGAGNMMPVAQAWHETGGFASPRWREANNPAGLGATDDGAWGATFATPEAGILAQYAHLICYASAPHELREPLAGLALLSPRRDALARTHGLGVAPLWAGLSRRWATDPEYAAKVLRVAGDLFGEGR